MKTLTLTTLFLACFALTSFSQDTTKAKPKATYQVGTAKVTVWENKKADGSTWKNFRVEKVYKKADKWETTNSFNDKELLELKAAVDKAIAEESVKVKTIEEKK